jgi:prolyl oligopeptidase
VLTATTLNEKVYFHKLGDPQQADKVIYERPDHPNWTFGPQVMEGGKILVFDIYTGVPGTNLLAWRDLNRQTPAKDLIATALHGYQPIEVAGSLLYLLTNDGAPRGRVIAMDLLQPDRAH